MSPQSIGWALRDDTYRFSLAWTPYKGGLLIQCAKTDSGRADELPGDCRYLLEGAPEGTTHLLLHADGPVHPLRLHDRDSVLSAYRNPPFLMHCDDSFFADTGSEKLWDDPSFDGSPLHFERMATYYETQFSRLATNSDAIRLEAVVDTAYKLACGVEHMKLNTENFWTTCDAAMKAMGEAMDPIIDSFEESYDSKLHYLEGILLGARSRVYRRLRVSSAWRRDYNWRNAGLPVPR